MFDWMCMVWHEYVCECLRLLGLSYLPRLPSEETLGKKYSLLSPEGESDDGRSYLLPTRHYIELSRSQCPDNNIDFDRSAIFRNHRFIIMHSHIFTIMKPVILTPSGNKECSILVSITFLKTGIWPMLMLMLIYANEFYSIPWYNKSIR